MESKKYLRILVCGGRDYGRLPSQGPIKDTAAYRAAKAKADFQVFLLKQKLDELTIDEGEMLPRRGTVIIHGCALGADLWADSWAVDNWVPSWPYPITPEHWQQLGRKAGPLRNQRMLADSKPDLLLAFPTGGPGTTNMIMLARAQGVRVIEVRPSEMT